jgi:hypothetical protein
MEKLWHWAGDCGIGRAGLCFAQIEALGQITTCPTAKSKTNNCTFLGRQKILPLVPNQ